MLFGVQECVTVKGDLQQQMERSVRRVYLPGAFVRVRTGINAKRRWRLTYGGGHPDAIGTAPRQEPSTISTLPNPIVRQFNQFLERAEAALGLKWRLIMSTIATVNGPKSKSIRAIIISVVPLVVVGSLALAAQDRYTLKIPDGLAWSEFRGYETWQDVAVSQTETSLKVIAANDAMTNAYRDGVPDNGKLFPDGSKIAKIEWAFKKNTVSPYS